VELIVMLGSIIVAAAATAGAVRAERQTAGPERPSTPRG
jgi:hypothetical protein